LVFRAQSAGARAFKPIREEGLIALFLSVPSDDPSPPARDQRGICQAATLALATIAVVVFVFHHQQLRINRVNEPLGSIAGGLPLGGAFMNPCCCDGEDQLLSFQTSLANRLRRPSGHRNSSGRLPSPA
jgi:hypothetical protein